MVTLTAYSPAPAPIAVRVEGASVAIRSSRQFACVDLRNPALETTSDELVGGGYHGALPPFVVYGLLRQLNPDRVQKGQALRSRSRLLV